ncbi:hypothetical protein SDJN02_21372, partial [Cucurbita argyrosperma subsp. argyrosperma]
MAQVSRASRKLQPPTEPTAPITATITISRFILTLFCHASLSPSISAPFHAHFPVVDVLTRHHAELRKTVTA